MAAENSGEQHKLQTAEAALVSVINKENVQNASQRSFRWMVRYTGSPVTPSLLVICGRTPNAERGASEGARTPGFLLPHFPELNSKAFVAQTETSEQTNHSKPHVGKGVRAKSSFVTGREKFIFNPLTSTKLRQSAGNCICRVRVGKHSH